MPQPPPPVVTSWLVDQTPALSTNEKTFATQLEAMGFERPCVSRAIKRLGRDEKEVTRNSLLLLVFVKTLNSFRLLEPGEGV